MTEEFFTNPMETRRQMASDPHRPTFHFLPPRNWMNDPNGLCEREGKVHLFYQFNPFGALWGSIHWGHASSTDMVHWQDHPIALWPEDGAGDDRGCFSGCVVKDGKVAKAIYTGFVSPKDTPVLIAEAQDPDLIHWQKSAHNPVISQKPQGVNDTDFRDPYVWREGDIWKMVIGAGMQNGNSAVLLYDSADLFSWDYQGILFEKQSPGTVSMWECPNFFKLGDTYVLLVSLFPGIQGVYFYTGNYDGREFVPQTEGFFDQGPIFYAPQVRRFADGRTILFSWLLEGRSDAAAQAAGWAGVQAIPRELFLDEEQNLASRPIVEMERLRQKSVLIESVLLLPGEKIPIDIHSKHFEIEMEIESSEGRVGFGVLASPGGEEMTILSFDYTNNSAQLDTTQSSLSNQVSTGKQEQLFPGGSRESLRIHAYIDGSVIEVWFDERMALTGRAYPTLMDSDGLFIFVEGAEARISFLRVWEMDAIWPTKSKG